MSATKDQVQRYWEDAPCGSVHASSAEGTLEYFAQIERQRYTVEPFIPYYADFAGSRGKRVLEIGVGIGTDFVNFARCGADVTGIDLTQHAVSLVRQRLELEGLQGDVRQADAEQLPFPDDSFDQVYSWGVLHHTPDTAKAIREVIRVLRPGGRACIMLYGRHSWFSYGLWLKFALLRRRPRMSLGRVLSEHMESAGTKAYTVSELQALFSGLQPKTIEKVLTAYDRRFSGPLSSLTGNRLGWFIVTRGVKPSVAPSAV